MKVVIFCGGLGTRLREETEFRPKPMVPVGERPILWHIMKTYAYYGHKEFILCLGYKGEAIKEYFRNYHWNTNDVTLSLGAATRVPVKSLPPGSLVEEADRLLYQAKQDGRNRTKARVIE